MTETVRVLIVDDDALVRAGLSMMLDGTDGIIVVGEVSDGDKRFPQQWTSGRPTSC